MGEESIKITINEISFLITFQDGQKLEKIDLLAYLAAQIAEVWVSYDANCSEREQSVGGCEMRADINADLMMSCKILLA